MTDQYNDVQNDLDKYKLEKENLQKTLDKFKLFNPTTDEERANIQAQISRLKREIALNERMIKSYEEQTGMSVVTINFYDQFKNTARDTTPTWQKMIADEWQNTKITAIMIFTRIFFKVVYLFSYIAPLALWIGIFWVIYLVLRLFRKK